MLRYEFLLSNKDGRYPIVKDIFTSLKKSTGLDLNFEEVDSNSSTVYNLVLSHLNVSESVWISWHNGKSLLMMTKDKSYCYLWSHVTFVLINITLSLGGGKLLVNMGKLGEYEINPFSMGKIYNEVSNFSEDLIWASKSYKIAKDIVGFNP